MYIPSSFILLSNTFIQNISYLPAVVPRWQKAVNDSLIIIIPHIHTYRKQMKNKSLTLKYTNVWIFKSREKFSLAPHKSHFFFSGGDENRLLQLKIDLFLTAQ